MALVAGQVVERHANHVHHRIIRIWDQVTSPVVRQIEHVVRVDQEFFVSDQLGRIEAAGDAVDPVGVDGDAGVDPELAVGAVKVVLVDVHAGHAVPEGNDAGDLAGDQGRSAGIAVARVALLIGCDECRVGIVDAVDNAERIVLRGAVVEVERQLLIGVTKDVAGGVIDVVHLALSVIEVKDLAHRAGAVVAVTHELERLADFVRAGVDLEAFDARRHDGEFHQREVVSEVCVAVVARVDDDLRGLLDHPARRHVECYSNQRPRHRGFDRGPDDVGGGQDPVAPIVASADQQRSGAGAGASVIVLSKHLHDAVIPDTRIDQVVVRSIDGSDERVGEAVVAEPQSERGRVDVGGVPIQAGARVLLGINVGFDGRIAILTV